MFANSELLPSSLLLLPGSSLLDSPSRHRVSPKPSHRHLINWRPPEMSPTYLLVPSTVCPLAATLPNLLRLQRPPTPPRRARSRWPDEGLLLNCYPSTTRWGQRFPPCEHSSTAAVVGMTCSSRGGDFSILDQDVGARAATWPVERHQGSRSRGFSDS